MNLRTKILDKVLTPEEYKKKDFSDPYILELTNKYQGIVFYGTEHSNNPKHPKFLDIEKRFKTFLTQYSLDKVSIAVESLIPKEDLPIEEMVSKYKESGFLKYLANKYSVEIFCPEPRDKIIPLLLDFTKEGSVDVSSWIFLNSLASKFQFTSVTETLSSISNFVKNTEYKDIQKRLADVDLTIPGTVKELEEEINEVDLVKVDKLLAPSDSTVFNKISSDFRNVRDRYIAQEILKILSGGKSIFSVFGTNHVIAQEPVYNYFFSKQAVF